MCVLSTTTENIQESFQEYEWLLIKQIILNMNQSLENAVNCQRWNHYFFLFCFACCALILRWHLLSSLPHSERHNTRVFLAMFVVGEGLMGEDWMGRDEGCVKETSDYMRQKAMWSCSSCIWKLIIWFLWVFKQTRRMKQNGSARKSDALMSQFLFEGLCQVVL